MPWLTSYSWSAAVASALVVTLPIASLIFSMPQTSTMSCMPLATAIMPTRSAAAPEPQAASIFIASMPRNPMKSAIKRAQVLLAVQLARQHVAHIERIGRLNRRIAHGRHDCVMRQVAQRFLPVLAHGRLADADNGYVSHVILVGTWYIGSGW